MQTDNLSNSEGPNELPHYTKLNSGIIRSLLSLTLSGFYLCKLYKRLGHCIQRGNTVTYYEGVDGV